MKIYLRYRYLVISSEDLSESRNLKIVNVNYPLAPLLIQISRLAPLARNDSVASRLDFSSRFARSK